jgi:hypothetical protein
MNYSQYVQNKDIVIGSNFRDILMDPDQNITGFYLDLSDAPGPEVPSELNKLVTYEPSIPGSERGRDKVEEIYSKSYPFGWIPLTTTRTLTGFEMYVDMSLLPPDYFALADSNKYHRWFLGYKNNLTNEYHPCIYGHGAREMLKIGVKNTITLNLNHLCEFELITNDSKSYIDYLEISKRSSGNISPSYYRLGELDREYLNKESHTKSFGVGTISRGKLNFNNQ